MFNAIRSIIIFACIIAILLVWLFHGKKQIRSIIIAYAVLATLSWLTIIFPPESLLVGFSSEYAAYSYISGTNSANSITQISGESSVLIIESNVNGAITPHLLINKKQKWYITSDVLYSFCHADDYWDDEYSVYYLSHPLIDETYWMVCDTSDCANIYETVTAFGEHDSGTSLEYVDSIGKKTYWFFHTDDGYLPLYVNGLFANDYCYTKDFRRET